MEIERVSAEIVDAAVRLHREPGPGLLESVYERVLAASLSRAGLQVDRQVPVSFQFEGMHFDDAFKVDLLVERCVVVELKSSQQFAPVYGKQVLTYLRLMNLQVGLLLNFGQATMKEGIRRIVNDHSPSSSASPRLRVKSEFRE
ncbi:MAG TPA: GxxExxY protein [Novosphingobium sp.]|nr:GxxExxY protein [Novosphingobium sp.]